jgi:hypothetical protein
MTNLTFQRWKRINEFADAMLNTVLAVLDGLKEPAEFVSALRNLPSIDAYTRQSANLGMGTPVENLVCSIIFYRMLSRKLMAKCPTKVNSRI